MATDKLINQTQGEDIIEALSSIADNIENVPSSYEFSSAQVVSMAGYEKATETSAISQADTLNQAIGKLEKGLESIEPATAQSEQIYSTKGLNKTADTWVAKTWSGLTNFYGGYIWSDGDQVYLSDNSSQYVLNKSTSTWVAKTWSGLTTFSGTGVWSDGNDIYYSSGSNQYVLNKETSTWSAKTWTGYTPTVRDSIWTDGSKVYYSNNSDQYVLNKATGNWSVQTWNGLPDPLGTDIWTDGTNVYFSSGSAYQYVLDKSTSTWNPKTWTGLGTIELYGRNIWTDSYNCYTFNPYSGTYVLDTATGNWSVKTWIGYTGASAASVWTDGLGIYSSDWNSHYVLKRPIQSIAVPAIMNNAELTAVVGNIDAVLEAVL